VEKQIQDEWAREQRMIQHRISASKFMPAPAERVYEIIADYECEHALILPRPPFVSMSVTRGGRGAGTEFDLVMRVMGKTENYHGVVSEPAAGRVIEERYVGTSTVTRFTVEPRNLDRGAKVSITTDLVLRAGLLGVVQRWFATRLLRSVYLRELQQLARIASDAAPRAPSHRASHGTAEPDSRASNTDSKR
jgi:hypothetical protein